MHIDAERSRSMLPILSVATALLAPLSLLSLPLFIGSWSWLLYLENWQLPLIGTVITIAFPSLMWLPMLPAVGIGLLAGYRLECGDRISAHLLTLIANIYTLASIFVFCAAILLLGRHFMRVGAPIYPYLMWSFATATIQYNRMASDENLPVSTVGALCANAAMIAAVSTALINGIDETQIAVAMATTLAFGFIALSVTSAMEIEQPTNIAESLIGGAILRRRRRTWVWAGVVSAIALAAWLAHSSRQPSHSQSDDDRAPRFRADGSCADWSHAMRHSYFDICLARKQ